jgi:hypothetical protein
VRLLPSSVKWRDRALKREGDLIDCGGTMDSYNIKAAIAEDVKELDLALIILNCLRDVNMARLASLSRDE